MENKKLIQYSLLHSVGVVVYVFLVAGLMWKSQDWFGRMNGMMGVMAMLMLFVLSATIVGMLVLGKPVMMYLDGKKKEAMAFLLNTVGWLAIWLVVVFGVIMVC